MSATAIVLLSGGLDSATALAVAQGLGLVPHALSFRYGQRHAIEVEAARAIAQRAGVIHHTVIDIDLRVFGASALTCELAVPKVLSPAGSGPLAGDEPGAPGSTGIPITYVPARNTIFLSYALALAEVTGAPHIVIGVNAVDYSGYPDCRPAFIAAFQAMANLATKAAVAEGRPVTIHTPLIWLSKADIIRRGLSLGVDYGLTRSCYDPDPEGRGCGRCDSCRIRLTGFREAGLDDPAPYQPR